MTQRKFKQMGESYGIQPVHVVATIDGVEQCRRYIDPVAEKLPVLPDHQKHGTDLFEWTEPKDWAGTRSMTIAVTGGLYLLTDTMATYGLYRDFSALIHPPPLKPAGPTRWAMPYTTVIDGVTYKDPLTDIVINGMTQARERTMDVTGQWYWVIPDGGTFSCTINIQPGIDLPQ
jgi:hypothetical protein